MGQPGQRAARGSSPSSDSTVLLCPVPALLVTPCCQPVAPALLPSLEPTASLLCGVTVPWKQAGCEAVSASRDALCELSRPGWGKEMSFSLMLPIGNIIGVATRQLPAGLQDTELLGTSSLWLCSQKNTPCSLHPAQGCRAPSRAIPDPTTST